MSQLIDEKSVELWLMQALENEGYLREDVGEERESAQDGVLWGRVRAALARLNPGVKAGVLDAVIHHLKDIETPDLMATNRAFYRAMVNGVRVETGGAEEQTHTLVRVVAWDEVGKNEWLAVNQLTIQGLKEHRPDVILYLNGLPVVVFELKNPVKKQASLGAAYQQLQTYTSHIPALFVANGLLVCTDGMAAKMGALKSPFERFSVWRTLDSATPQPMGGDDLTVLVEGLLAPTRLLEYLRYFILFEDNDHGQLIKKVAAYHQYWAVKLALEDTLRASKDGGDRRIGVVWHTQGSGKSISMLLYAARVIQNMGMKNPTLVVVTDRTDLDDQLYQQFARAKDLIPSPVQAESRDDLRARLKVAAGGVIFTRMQKFSLTDDERNKGANYPMLSDRRNIVVIADEAHRTQYGFSKQIDEEKGGISAGFAANLRAALPNASFIGFTGTPIELEDRNTVQVFGSYIDTYTVSRAVEDQATVPIHYEARLARLELKEDEKPRVDKDFEEATEGIDETERHRLELKWSQLEALIGAPHRLRLVARDIVEHWRKRQEVLRGKGMIVCMSRRICVELYQQIIKLRPAWGSDNDREGQIKVVMTGSSSDKPEMLPHIRSAQALKEIEKRFKKPEDKLQLVIVCDMWLTGFDVPAAHTMYIDKPLKGHNLMQAVARVNRVYRDKVGGLIVDYLGVAQELRKAVRWYDRGVAREEQVGQPVEVFLDKLRDIHKIIKDMFFDAERDCCEDFKSSDAPTRVQAIKDGVNHVLKSDDLKKRFEAQVKALRIAASLVMHLDEARVLSDDIAYFTTIQAVLDKQDDKKKSQLVDQRIEAAIRQIVSRSVTADQDVVDVFALAGVDKPDISILSDEFLQSVQEAPHKNLQMEAMKRLLSAEIKRLGTRNVIQGKLFSQKLEEAIQKYQSRALDVVKVIDELIKLAKELKESKARGDQLKLSDDEMAFYDALAAHGDVKEVLGDAQLAKIAQALVLKLHEVLTVDWSQKDSTRADVRLKIKAVLRRFKYPPDKQQSAIEMVVQQAEVICRDWTRTGHPIVATPPDEPPSNDIVTATENINPVVEMTPAWQETLDTLGDMLANGELTAEEKEQVNHLLEAIRLQELLPPEIGHEPMGQDGHRSLGINLSFAWCEATKVAIVTAKDLKEGDAARLKALQWKIFRTADAAQDIIKSLL